MSAEDEFKGWAILELMGHNRLAGYARERFEAEAMVDRRFGRIPVLGAVIGTCRLVSCVPTGAMEVTDLERDWGDYTPGRFAFHLVDVLALPEPVPWKGALGLWEWERPLPPPAATRPPGVAGDRCAAGNECGRTGCSECQQ